MFQRIARRTLVPLLTVMVTFFHAHLASAQSGGGDEFSVHGGQWLPNQIEGMTEILPVVGARYAFALTNGQIELGGSNSHAYGVDLTTLSASFRGEIEAAQDTLALIYAGTDFNWYRPISEESRKSELGVHFGTAALFKIAGALWLRGDFKLMGGPGTSLYLGFGLAFRD